jgi:hypothetical protein
MVSGRMMHKGIISGGAKRRRKKIRYLVLFGVSSGAKRRGIN